MPYRDDAFFAMKDVEYVPYERTVNGPSSGAEQKQGDELNGDAIKQKRSNKKKKAVEDITPTICVNEQNPSEGSLMSHRDKNHSFCDTEGLHGSSVKASNSGMALTMANSSSAGGYGINTSKDNSSLMVPQLFGMFGSNPSDDFALPGENFMRSMVEAFNVEYADELNHQRALREATGDANPYVLPNSNLVLTYENADSSVYTPVVDPTYDPLVYDPGLYNLPSQSFQPENESFASSNHSYPEEYGTQMPTVGTSHMQIPCQNDNALINVGFFGNAVKNNNISFAYNSGMSNTISFGGFKEGHAPVVNASGGTLIGYNSAAGDQTPAEGSNSKVCAFNIMDTSRAHPISASEVHINPNPTEVLKMKRPAKPRDIATVGFPANVKSLLSTGIFDGVPVKYVSWSREKRLRGVISGTNYLCSCTECKNLKRYTSYEFEKHAGCKTKHPNNHIYFESGRTVYAVVLELRKTPPDLLFEMIKAVTGSPIHEENFREWIARDFEMISEKIVASMPWRGARE